MKFICPLLVVKDITISRNFYEQVLDQKLKYDFGENVIFEGDFSLHLVEHYKTLLGNEHDQIKMKTNNFELYFETEDLEKMVQKLKNIGIEFIHEIKEQPWGQRVARFYDPDYHIIEIGESMESVVLRYHRSGMNLQEIGNRTSMPIEFIEEVLLKKE